MLVNTTALKPLISSVFGICLLKQSTKSQPNDRQAKKRLRPSITLLSVIAIAIMQLISVHFFIQHAIYFAVINSAGIYQIEISFRDKQAAFSTLTAFDPYLPSSDVFTAWLYHFGGVISMIHAPATQWHPTLDS